MTGLHNIAGHRVARTLLLLGLLALAGCAAKPEADLYPMGNPGSNTTTEQNSSP